MRRRRVNLLMGGGAGKTPLLNVHQEQLSLKATMRSNIPIMFFVFLVPLSMTSAQEPLRWSVEERLMLDPQSGAGFAVVSGLAIDGQGSLFISDQIACSLTKCRPDGKFVGRTGKRGDLPGEFRSPAMTVSYADTLVVMQASNPAIQFLTTDLEPIGSRSPFDGQPVCLAVDRFGRLVIAGVRNGPGRQTLKVLPSLMSTGGREILLPPSSKADGFSDVCHLAVTPSGMFVVAYLFENRVLWLRGDGTVLRTLVLPQLRPLTKDERDAPIPGETSIKSVVADASGRVYLLGGSLAHNPHRDVFIFTEKGSYRGTATLPHPSRLLTSDRKGFLYGTSNESTVVRKYAIRPISH